MQVTTEEGGWAFDGKHIVSVDDAAMVEPFEDEFLARFWTPIELWDA